MSVSRLSLSSLTRPARQHLNKVRTINVYQKRDALALVQVTAATAIPSDVSVTEQTKEVLVESAEALYHDFQAADPIDSILATLMCGISSMTMDAVVARKAKPNS